MATMPTFVVTIPFHGSMPNFVVFMIPFHVSMTTFVAVTIPFHVSMPTFVVVTISFHVSMPTFVFCCFYDSSLCIDAYTESRPNDIMKNDITPNVT